MSARRWRIPIIAVAAVVAAAAALVAWRAGQRAAPDGARAIAARPHAVQRSTLEWSDPGTPRAQVWTPAGDARTFPVLVFSPGFGQAPGGYSTLLTTLASHGYVVVAVPHPPMENADRLELHDAAARFAGEIVAVVDRLAADTARFDTRRLGVIGHSVGGAAAALACAQDPRIRAGMNLDGTVYGRVVHAGVRQPFLLMMGTLSPLHRIRGRPHFYEQRDQARLHEDSMFSHSERMTWLTVDGLDHMSFTDAALAHPPRRGIRHMFGRRLAAADAQRLTIEYAVAFFGTHLQGAAADSILTQASGDGTTLRYHNETR
jgi:predicted dienelactone hydrolase